MLFFSNPYQSAKGRALASLQRIQIERLTAPFVAIVAVVKFARFYAKCRTFLGGWEHVLLIKLILNTQSQSAVNFPAVIVLLLWFFTFVLYQYNILTGTVLIHLSVLYWNHLFLHVQIQLWWLHSWESQHVSLWSRQWHCLPLVSILCLFVVCFYVLDHWSSLPLL